jgi:hypothetical protein
LHVTKLCGVDLACTGTTVYEDEIGGHIENEL